MRTGKVAGGAAAIIGVVLVVAACFQLLHTSAGQSNGQASQPVVSRSPLPAPSPSTASPHRPKPSAEPGKPQLMERVQPAPPSAIEIPSIGVRADVGRIKVTYNTGHQAVLAPPERTEEDLLRAYWWSERAAPASPSSGTTFIIGHTCHAQGCPAVFNSLQHIRPGALVRVVTPRGLLTYQVFRTKSYPKADITYARQVYENVAGRLVLVTCKLQNNGGIQTENFVVWAKLVRSVQQ